MNIYASGSGTAVFHVEHCSFTPAYEARCRPRCTGWPGAFERGGKAPALELLPICVFLQLKLQKSTNTTQCGREGGTLGCVFHVEHSVCNVPRGTSAYIYAAKAHKYPCIKSAYICVLGINMQNGEMHTYS